MSANRFAVIAAGLCLLAENNAANGHAGDRVFPVYQITEEVLDVIDVNDGSTHEWPELFEPTATALDFNIIIGESYDPFDLDFRLWMAWLPSPSRIYVALTVLDDIAVNRGERDFDIPDMVYFYVDADHSGGEPDAEWRDAQLYNSWPGIPERGFVIVGEEWPPTSGEWPAAFPYGEGDGVFFGENPFFWHVEFYITPFDALDEEPDDSIITELVLRETIGFAFMLWDRDDDEDLTAHYLPRIEDKDSWEYGGIPDFFADGILLGAERVGDEASSVVQSDSWGRIKASMR